MNNFCKKQCMKERMVILKSILTSNRKTLREYSRDGTLVSTKSL